MLFNISRILKLRSHRIHDNKPLLARRHIGSSSAILYNEVIEQVKCPYNYRYYSLKLKILVVEDEKEIADTLNYVLSNENFEPIWVATAEQALAKLKANKVALAILDVGLPDITGFELLKSIRKSGSDIPVIFLTARAEEIDRIVGLELGADDYVCKPFSPREVVTRVKVILKRASNTLSEDKPAAESFYHKQDQRVICFEDKSLDLTRAEYQLMVTFLSQPSRVFSRRQLIDSIWSSNHPSDDRAVDTHIKTLRAKLKPYNPHKDFIITHRGFGYSFEL